jgi:damage-control phosphatase, subfamily I
MNTGTDCFVCFMEQALKTVKLCTEDEALQQRVLVKIGSFLERIEIEKSPPENVTEMYQIISEMTSTPDPFIAIKRESNELALKLELNVREIIQQEPDPLFAAVCFAIGANVLDSGAQQQLDIHETLEKCLYQQFAIDHFSVLKKALSSAHRIFYLADNCGEIVFDKLIIEQLQMRGLEVTVGVRGLPVINDALVDDADYCGITKLCKVIPNGNDVPGTSLSQCSDEFRGYFKNADLIISKGMGNFECLSEIEGPVFFLLKVKCSTVLQHIKSRYPLAQLKIGSPLLIAPESFF